MVYQLQQNRLNYFVTFSHINLREAKFFGDLNFRKSTTKQVYNITENPEGTKLSSFHTRINEKYNERSVNNSYQEILVIMKLQNFFLENGKCG